MHDAIRRGRSSDKYTHNKKSKAREQGPQSNKNAMVRDDKRGRGNESTRGTDAETDRSCIEGEGDRHEEDTQEHTVRKATLIRARRGRARLSYNTITRSKTSRIPWQTEPRDETWQGRRC